MCVRIDSRMVVMGGVVEMADLVTVGEWIVLILDGNRLFGQESAAVWSGWVDR